MCVWVMEVGAGFDKGNKKQKRKGGKYETKEKKGEYIGRACGNM